jgi:3-hydroxyisobutyrate dehydrogenase
MTNEEAYWLYLSVMPDKASLIPLQASRENRVSLAHQQTVGIIGLGAMGRPTAEYLAAAGIPTSAYDVDEKIVTALSAKGVRPSTSLTELAAECDVILVFVPTDEDVREVCSPESGVFSTARAGSILLICSSVRPETCTEIEKLARPLGVAVLDAALTGGVRGAEAGEVNLLVGGDEQVLERVRPILKPWTKAVHHLGPLGAGQVGKTVNNLCHWAQISAITEALTLGARLGVEPSRLRLALQDGPADSRTLREIQLMRLTWHAKDLANAMAMAQTVSQPMPVAEVVREVMKGISVERVAALLADKEFSDA